MACTLTLDKIEKMLNDNWHHTCRTSGQAIMANPDLRDAYAMERFVKSLAPKIAEFSTDEADVSWAIGMFFRLITVSSREGAVNDHHAIDYGSPITYYIFNMGCAASLLNDPSALRNEIDKMKALKARYTARWAGVIISKDDYGRDTRCSVIGEEKDCLPEPQAALTKIREGLRLSNPEIRIDKVTQIVDIDGSIVYQESR